MSKLVALNHLFVLLIIGLITLAGTCNNEPKAVPEKITFDLSKIDENGLSGNSGGKVVIDYEFCIPADERLAAEVKKIDGTIKINHKAPGRIGCTKKQWLCLGNTHQKDWRKKLLHLTSLSYVERIDQNFFE